MVKIDSALSNKISWLSFLGACIIVLHHIPRSFIEGDALYHSVMQFHPFCLVGVPLFFILSGFLFVGGANENGWWKAAMKKRVKSLLIPYVTINLMYLPFVYLYHNLGGSAFHSDMPYTMSFVTILSSLGLWLPNNPACNPLWFVRFLLILMLIAPLFLYVIRKSHAASLMLVTCLISLWVLMPRFDIPEEVLSYRGLVFFTIGMHLRIYGLPRVYVWVGVVSLLFALCFSYLYLKGCVFSEFIVPLAGSYGLFALVPDKHKLAQLFAGASFSIYAFHIMCLYFIKVVGKILGFNDMYYYNIGAMFLVLFIPILSCSAFHRFVIACAPKVARVLFGGR